MKIQKNIYIYIYINFFGGSGLGVQDGCERNIEVFVKIQKRNGGGGLGGGRVGGQG